MSALFESPFLTERIGTRGGGIDFLGLRQVNLNMLQEELIPGLNNVTADMGTFCLGAWIPWKFEQICKSERDFVLSNYTVFREAIEAAMAYAMGRDSPSEQKFGPTRRRMGVTKQVHLPGPLTFDAAKREDTTSLYSAPLYGPSLRYLGLLKRNDARAEDGTSTGIPLAAKDDGTNQLMEYVDKSLNHSPHLKEVVQLSVPRMKPDAVHDLGLNGLNPTYYRRAPKYIKQAFAEKLFSDDEYGQRRWLTAALICETVREQGPLERIALHLQEQGWVGRDPNPYYGAMLRIWHTGLLGPGRRLKLSVELEAQRKRWAAFQARQIQRTVLETFLCCFETAINDGCRKIEDVVKYWQANSSSEFKSALAQPLWKLCIHEIGEVYRGLDFSVASELWNDKVHPSHPSFDDFDGQEESYDLPNALTVIARWWVRLHNWKRNEVLKSLACSGDRDRISIAFFCRWLESRMDTPLASVLMQLWSDLVFAQHIRFAIMRFDGEVQRLRFIVGDEGIVPTEEVGNKLGQTPVRMADRLPAFVGLLCDLEILQQDGEAFGLGQRPMPKMPVY